MTTGQQTSRQATLKAMKHVCSRSDASTVESNALSTVTGIVTPALRYAPLKPRPLVRVLLLAFTILASTMAVADPDRQVIVNSEHKRIGLGSFIEFHEDPDGELTIGELLQDPDAVKWQRSARPTPNFAYSKSVYWVRVEFLAATSTAQSWLFEIAFPLQDYIDYYVTSQEGILSHVHTGDRTPFSSRQHDYRNFLFDLELPPGEKRTVYLRLESHDGLHEALPLILWDKETFTYAKGPRDLWLGVFLGVVLVMAAYNLFLHFTVKDRAYLYYVLYICFFALWAGTYHGLTFQYLWPEHPGFANQAIVIIMSLLSIFIIQFIRTFLDTKRYAPWMETVGKVFIIMNLFMLFSRVYDEYAFSIMVFIVQSLIAWISAILAGIDCLRKGFRPARYFLYAWTIFMTSVVTMSLKSAGLIESNWLTEHIVQLGCIIEVILLSLGLGDRINELKKQAFIAKAKALEAVQSSLALKNEFITAISHELRTPMNAVIGGLQLEERGKDNQLTGNLAIVESGAQDMMRLVNDILVYTEIQSGQLSLHTSPQHIPTLLETIEPRYQRITAEKGLDLSIELDESLPTVVLIDGDKVLTVISKLMDNACKFTSQGFVKLEIAFKGDSNKGLLIISVSDSGQGISEEEKQRVFEPFMQASGGFRRDHEGIGIGLSICEHLVKLQGGTLSLMSSPGNGSEFSVSIPCKASQKAETAELTERESEHLPVLVVEDNLVNQKVITKMLNKLSIKSDVAENGALALDKLEQKAYSLILMDLQMPVMDGFTCTETIRASGTSYHNIPVIAVSANLMDADKTRCIACGMNDFMAKPVKLTQLSEAVAPYVR